jgi:hypothetical protein
LGFRAPFFISSFTSLLTGSSIRCRISAATVATPEIAGDNGRFELNTFASEFYASERSGITAGNRFSRSPPSFTFTDPPGQSAPAAFIGSW